MRTTATKILLGTAAAILFSGCAQNQPKYEDGVCTTLPKEKVYIDTSTGNKVIEKHYVYTPDVDLKKAVYVLIKKVDNLESKMGRKTFPNAKPVTEVAQKGCGPAVPVKKKQTLKYKNGMYKSYKRVPVWSCATKRGSRIGWIEANKKVTLKECGIFGWCKIDGRKGYVQAWRLKKI